MKVVGSERQATGDNLEALIRVLPENLQNSVHKPEHADVVVTTRPHEDEPLITDLADRGVPIHTVKKVSTAQLRRILQNAFHVLRGVNTDEVAEAVQEAEYAIQRVLNDEVEVRLAPRGAALRKMQHQIISRYHLVSESSGTEPNRHLIIFPPQLRH